mmetsp:Transcript_45481/g.120983  ORF Transcript_45481/g.120983 Transcript_45481/m.120983 type:complete len:440 (-) Transcript_45481:27-1346(-)
MVDRANILEESNSLSADSIWNTTEIRRKAHNWNQFRDARLISDREAQLLSKFSKEPQTSQGAFASEDPTAFCQAFLTALKGISSDEPTQYLVTTLDELMKESKDIAKLFKPMAGTTLDPVQTVSALLTRGDELVVARACNVVVHLLGAGVEASAETVRFLFDFVRRESANESKRSKFCFVAIIGVLQGLLRDSKRRTSFYDDKGLQFLLPIIKTQSGNIQLVYQACHCVWLLSFSPDLKPKLADLQLAAVLTHALKLVQKEKVIRMILGALVNLIEEGDMKVILSVCGAHKLLENMKQRTWADEDIVSDMNLLLERVSENVERRSNFDEYCKEVLSGELEWTPMHRSQAFWEKNAVKFEDKDAQVLKVLVEIIKPGGRNESKAVSIALHDIGEFVKAHPTGKAIITRLNAKPYIMQQLTSADPDVNKEALMCVQKLMVH